jgi:hypothetical protein
MTMIGWEMKRRKDGDGWMDAIPERSHTITTTDRPEERDREREKESSHYLSVVVNN